MAPILRQQREAEEAMRKIDPGFTREFIDYTVAHGSEEPTRVNPVDVFEGQMAELRETGEEKMRRVNLATRLVGLTIGQPPQVSQAVWEWVGKFNSDPQSAGQPPEEVANLLKQAASAELGRRGLNHKEIDEILRGQD